MIVRQRLPGTVNLAAIPWADHTGTPDPTAVRHVIDDVVVAAVLALRDRAYPDTIIEAALLEEARQLREIIDHEDARDGETGAYGNT